MWLAQFKGQTVLVGVDDLDVFKGVELKLLALEQARALALQPNIVRCARCTSVRLHGAERHLHLGLLAGTKCSSSAGCMPARQGL